MTLEDYTKADLIVAIRKVFKCQEKLLQELPIIQYNRMCDAADKLSKEASTALGNNDIRKARELFDKSTKLWESANAFIDKTRNREIAK